VKKRSAPLMLVTQTKKTGRPSFAARAFASFSDGAQSSE